MKAMICENIHNLGFRRRSGAFTLIELLIVVAIIAILAVIALPNFLEAQTRSKVARVKSDMRALDTALNTYAVDWNRYPVVDDILSGNVMSFQQRLAPLTSPVGYISTLPGDPFSRQGYNGAHYPGDRTDIYAYNTGAFGLGVLVANTADLRQLSWSLMSGGPDGLIQFPYYAFTGSLANNGGYILFVYDPTNGTTSFGDIFRRGGAGNQPLAGVE